MTLKINKPEPAFRKWTPAVDRGAKYLLAVAEFDATHGAITLSDGTPVETTIDAKDIAAAGEWLRYQIKSNNKPYEQPDFTDEQKSQQAYFSKVAE